MKMESRHNRRYNAGNLLVLLLLVAIVVLSSCNTARRVPQGQYLLKHNSIIYPAGAAKGKGIEKKLTTLTKQQFANLKIPPEIAPQFILTYVKQKPNTKILSQIPLHLMIFNIVNPEKAQEKKLERDQKIDDKNKKRIAEGKPGLSEEKLKAKKQRKTWREWLMGAGEPPVILDSEFLKASVKQIKLFLQSKGYQDCIVHDSVSVKNKKAKVFYILKPGKPYKIDSLKYVCEDSSIAPVIYADSGNCLINQGDNFDREAFLKERDRITHYLNDNGYYSFAKEYIQFDIDSQAVKHRFNVAIDIKKYTNRDTITADSIILVETSHRVYHIRNVTLQMQYNPSNPSYNPEDTTSISDYTMVYPKDQMGVKLKKLLGRIFIKKGDLYRISEVDNTYTALSQMKSFRYINIKFVTVGKDALDCYIQLMPTVRHSLGIEGEITSTGGDKGTQANGVYDDKNLFKACDLFTAKMKFGFEEQKILGQNNTTGFSSVIGLNTIDIGPELDLAIPRPWIPFNLGANIDSLHLFKKKKFGLWAKANPQTVFKAKYDFQNRPDYYARHVFGLAYTFNYDPYEKKNQRKWNIELKLPEINFVHATLLPGFQRLLDSLHNFFLLNSFTNHFIPDLAVAITYNNTQVPTKKHHRQFAKISLEESGGILNLFDKVTYGSSGQNFTIGGVPYTQYLKEELDLRDYWNFSKDDKLAGRILIGLGQPLGNYNELPFDKSFWAGGANDIRGWEARTLGPGGYNEQLIVDQIGDIKFEANIEYRLNIIKIFGLGFFIDAGNVWLLNPNSAVPNGDFKWNTAARQIAVANGIGLRFDFTYFVFRFDLGQPWRDPSRQPGTEWISPSHWSIPKTVLNFGIGYPF